VKLPVISGKEAIRAFEKAGWSVERRAKSRHIIMKKSGRPTTLSVPEHKVLDRGLSLQVDSSKWCAQHAVRAGSPLARGTQGIGISNSEQGMSNSEGQILARGVSGDFGLGSE